MGFLEVFRKKDLSNGSNESIVPGEEVFCAIQAVDNSLEDLVNRGFLRIPDGLVAHADALAQYAPGAAVAMMESGLYKAVFNPGLGVLQKSAQYPGLYLGNVVSPDKNNAIKAVAAWQRVSATPQIALGIFTAVSVATGQYFMAQTNKKLESLATGIESLQQFVEEDDYNTLHACQNYFAYVQNNLRSIMDNDIQRQSTATNIEQKVIDCDKITGKYKNLIDKIRLKRGKNREEIQKTLNTFSKYVYVYRAALILYSYGMYLEAILVQNTDSKYLQNVAAEIQKRQNTCGENLAAWEQKFSNYIEKARAFKLDRFLEEQKANHFWDKPINRVKEAVQLKREDHPLEEARECFSSIIDPLNDFSSVESVQKNIDLLDRVYNRPIEVVMSGNDLYVKISEAVS